MVQNSSFFQSLEIVLASEEQFSQCADPVIRTQSLLSPLISDEVLQVTCSSQAQKINTFFPSSDHDQTSMQANHIATLSYYETFSIKAKNISELLKWMFSVEHVMVRRWFQRQVHSLTFPVVLSGCLQEQKGQQNPPQSHMGAHASSHKSRQFSLKVVVKTITPSTVSHV